MLLPADLDLTIARYATHSFTDATLLLDAGIPSLSLMRLVVDALPNGDTEIDVTSLVDLRTVGDLKSWLIGQAGGAC